MPTEKKESGIRSGRPLKKITRKEKDFANLIISSGLGSIEAARKVFHWKCEPGSSEARRAVELIRTSRVKEYLEKQREIVARETEAESMMQEFSILDQENLRKTFYNNLVTIRDNREANAQTRYNAINALKKLADPSSDHSLIMKWVDIIWRGMQAHCPRCHNTYPLWMIENKALNDWRKENDVEPDKEVKELFPRRMEILSRADRRKTPHKSQEVILTAPERHIAGLGAARGGKSYLLSMMALLGYLIPGVEIWILARVYEDAKSEVEYLNNFLNTLFFPHMRHMIDVRQDVKSGEMIMTSKWGSTLKVRSAKAKGSITGRELEMALVAEPAWVPEDIYEELRARMSSRLGRIILLGTAKGYTGILARMINQTGRDPKTGKIRRISKEERRIDAGMPWISSMLVQQMLPEDNPEYVKAEKEAARMELTDAEFASEFEGLMTSEEGAKFPLLEQRHLMALPREEYENCVFVLGVDQGPKNFGAVLLGYNGQRVFVMKEYFAVDNKTMRYHMRELQRIVPIWIRQAGGDKRNWKLTIFDADPPILSELEEFEENVDETPWPTEYTWRVKNATAKGIQENWRDETYEYLNNLCVPIVPDVVFDLNGEDIYLLHDQLLRAQNVPVDRTKESRPGNSKGWLITDSFRGDHLCDAFLMALWTIFSSQLTYDGEPAHPPENVWEEHEAAFKYNLQAEEQRELSGFQPKNARKRPDEIFEDTFKRPRNTSWLGGVAGYYENES